MENISNDPTPHTLPPAATAVPYISTICRVVFRDSSFLVALMMLWNNFSMAYFRYLGIPSSQALTGKVLTVSSKCTSMGSWNLEELLAMAFQKVAVNAVFLQGVVDFFSLSTATKLIDKAPIPMADKLTANLPSSTHEIRSHSLRCLELLHIAESHRRQDPGVVSTLKIIENTQFEISNTRNISLYVR